MTESAFRYERSLQGREIRLIQLTSPEHGDEIRCSLVYKALNADIIYNALSYVWGDPLDKRQVICNGMACMITVNLFNALTRIRRTHAGVLLWADALCIDQGNQLEKTRQVRMMGEIYSQAQRVVVWLGAEQEHDREGYSIACRVYDLLGDVAPDIEDAYAESGRTLDLGEAGLPEEPDDIRWHYVSQLLAKEWFSRIWIVQEFLRAKSSIFLCGELEMDPEVILNVTTHLSTRYQFRAAMTLAPFGNRSSTADTSLMGTSLRFLRQKRNEQAGLDIFTLLGITKAFRSTDPRDRIFALIGLQHDIPLEYIDYSHETSFVELQITLAILSWAETPTGVLACVTSLVPRPGMPSWVPAWGKEMRQVMEFVELVLPIEDCDDGVPDYWVEDQKVRYLSLFRIDRKFIQILVAITRSHDV